MPGRSDSWRGDEENGGTSEYEDVKGFCKSAPLDEIADHNHVLTPGCYVDIKDVDVEDDEPFEVKMDRLTDALSTQFAEAVELDERIRENLREVRGYRPADDAATVGIEHNRQIKKTRAGQSLHSNLSKPPRSSSSFCSALEGNCRPPGLSERTFWRSFSLRTPAAYKASMTSRKS